MESLIDSITTIQNQVISILKIAETDIDSILMNEDSLKINWKFEQKNKRTLPIIDELRDPFISHPSMIIMEISGNQSMVNASWSRFKQFYGNNRANLTGNEIDLGFIESKFTEVEMLFNNMKSLGANYEVLCVKESKR